MSSDSPVSCKVVVGVLAEEQLAEHRVEGLHQDAEQNFAQAPLVSVHDGLAGNAESQEKWG